MGGLERTQRNRHVSGDGAKQRTVIATNAARQIDRYQHLRVTSQSGQLIRNLSFQSTLQPGAKQCVHQDGGWFGSAPHGDWSAP